MRDARHDRFREDDRRERDRRDSRHPESSMRRSRYPSRTRERERVDGRKDRERGRDRDRREGRRGYDDDRRGRSTAKRNARSRSRSSSVRRRHSSSKSRSRERRRKHDDRLGTRSKYSMEKRVTRSRRRSVSSQSSRRSSSRSSSSRSSRWRSNNKGANKVKWPKNLKKRANKESSLKPPTDLAEYENEEGTGWCLWKKSEEGKAVWKYHPETTIFFSANTNSYFLWEGEKTRQLSSSDPRIEHLLKLEEVREAVKEANFVEWKDGEGETAKENAELGSGGPSKAPLGVSTSTTIGPSMPPPATQGARPKFSLGKVVSFDPSRGFGFIKPVNKDGSDLVGADGKPWDSKKNIFVHRRGIEGSTVDYPINLEVGRFVRFVPQDDKSKLPGEERRKVGTEVSMLEADMETPAKIHSENLEALKNAKKPKVVTCESLSIRAHAESWPGLKNFLHDRTTVGESLEESGVFFGLYDGHGGGGVAEYLSNQLHKNLLQNYKLQKVGPLSSENRMKACLKESVLACETHILDVSDRKPVLAQQGSTALACVVQAHPASENSYRVMLGHVGDSKALLCRDGVCVELTLDHSPLREDERKRVERAGGQVMQVGQVLRVTTSQRPGQKNVANRKEMQGLAMTRSVGDLLFKQTGGQAIIPEPEITVFDSSEKDLFLMLCSDGIFEKLSTQQAMDVALDHWQDAEEAAKAVVRKASTLNSEDNLTCMIVQFGTNDAKAPNLVAQRKLQISTGEAAKKKPVEDDDFDMFA